MAMLWLGRYIKKSLPIDILSSLACLWLLVYLKNEGVLAALIGLGLLILTVFIKKSTLPGLYFFQKHWKYFLSGFFAMIPFFVWNYYKFKWGISNDLQVGSAPFFSRILTRLFDGSSQLILKNFYEQVKGSLLVLGVFICIFIFQKKKIVLESLPPLLAAILYAVALFLIYLSTPYDLIWHLNTSVSRTLLLVNGCVFIASYFILNQIEEEFRTLFAPN